MPPKPKYTKEEIVAAAFDIAREQGIEAVAAREVGRRLGTSSSPIFTVMSGMEEVQQEVTDRAWKQFADYLQVADEYNPSFKMRGIQFVRFSREEPQLFRLLFMRRDTAARFTDLMQERIVGFERDIEALRRDYHITAAQARHLFEQLWVYAYGICSLCITGTCVLTDGEVAALLGEAFLAMIMLAQRGGSVLSAVTPARKDTPEGARMDGAIPGIQNKEEEASC